MQIVIRRASGGQFYWQLLADDQQVLATSESYYQKDAVRRAAEALKAKAASAPIVDRS